MEKAGFQCPHCGGDIQLSDLEQHAIEASMKNMEEKFRKEQQITEEKLRKDFADKEGELKKEMWTKAQNAAKVKLDDEFKEKLIELQSLRERDEKARARELEFLKEKQALESKQKDLEIEKERAIIAAKKEMEEQMRKEAQERNSFEIEKFKADFEKRLAEKEKQTEILKKALDDATMKANQGSMQIQGETQENALKQALQSEFPIDTIDDVPTGIKGADLVQTVRSMKGEEVGIIAWESKDAKLWSDAWAEKLKEDRLRVGASISVIVTTVLPQGMKHFGVYKGVWVTAWQYAIPLTVALREKLLESHTLKGSLVAKDEKMEVLYSYLTSPDFRDKIQNIVEAFQVLKDELEKEKRAMERLWAQREKQLERVMKNTAGMYGDMQGLLGTKMHTVQAFELDDGNADVF